MFKYYLTYFYFYFYKNGVLYKKEKIKLYFFKLLSSNFMLQTNSTTNIKLNPLVYHETTAVLYYQQHTKALFRFSVIFI